MKKYFIIFILFLAVISCSKFKNTKSGIIEFSTDTVFFDTIFTQVGSTTQRFKIYNKTSTPILINKIYLASAENSKYRLNIDGYISDSQIDISLDAHDSLYIFVEVTIDPAKDDLIELDSIVFVSGDNIFNVKLLSVGKDVHLINSQVLKTQTWTNDKAYLIYNSILVDTLETLTIEPGVEIFSHRNSYILVKGTLIAEGTPEQKIVFRGDRIDNDEYKDIPGQWGGIAFMKGSFGNILNFCEVKESELGLYVIQKIDEVYPTLFVNNSFIGHNSTYGVCGLNTKITVINSVIADCGIHTVALLLGGNYSFFHCTIQNDYKWISRQNPALAFSNFYKDENDNLVFVDNLTAYFANCIIYGSLENEFVASAYDTTNAMSFSFVNCLMKLKLSVNDTSQSMYQNCLVNLKPKYLDPEKFKYLLTDTSPVLNKGNIDIVTQNLQFLQFDMNNIDRLEDGKPDIGAFEFKK